MDAAGKLAVIVLSSLIFSLPYTVHILSRLPAGSARFFACFPLFLLNKLTPSLFNVYDEILLKLVVLFVFTWLANFKLVGLCMNRGPLAEEWSTAQTAAICFLPIYPVPRAAGASNSKKGRLHDQAGDPSSLLIRWIVKLGVFCVVVVYLMSSELILTPFSTFALALVMYCFIGVLMDGPGSFVTYFLGFNIIPTFDQPWMSSSFADFWGRRWNITTSHMLRAVVYDPIVEGCLVRTTYVKPSGKTVGHQSPADKLMSTFLGICATFLVSGIIHEAIFWCAMPDRAFRWKWLVFFTMQGPLVIMEYIVTQWCRMSRSLTQVSPWVTRPVVLAAMIYMGQHLFMAPAVLDTDLSQRVLLACKASILIALDVVGISK
ncbi:hypothetical protein CEUSTIGMA_g7490.t1 [Chlamydomonas eustigma]|uniref:Wax synthase domain-containing protein n=1 Tax=Chlamydomonas eustigma TaxID=1157962 RepID=A0A250XAD3_9CHLO|nr:hypothetical protein CEUSTIGMA_g7490.t1 [Chlamydomonas eustigma]|eukprot:GAX80051.1 hypothetical protein CEUSTIGMA_g7490.t1 [Chlamydomonas eustigma]